MTDLAAVFRTINEQIRAATTTMQLLDIRHDNRSQWETLPTAIRGLLNQSYNTRMRALELLEFA